MFEQNDVTGHKHDNTWMNSTGNAVSTENRFPMDCVTNKPLSFNAGIQSEVLWTTECSGYLWTWSNPWFKFLKANKSFVNYIKRKKKHSFLDEQLQGEKKKEISSLYYMTPIHSHCGIFHYQFSSTWMTAHVYSGDITALILYWRQVIISHLLCAGRQNPARCLS